MSNTISVDESVLVTVLRVDRRTKLRMSGELQSR
jgi:hypothetical protein